VDRDGAPAGAERPFGDLCIRSFNMHAGLEYSEIIMTGACLYEGKTFRAVASSKPGMSTWPVLILTVCYSALAGSYFAFPRGIAG